MVQMLLVLLENRVLQVREDLQECLVSQVSRIPQGLQEVLGVQEHQSLDQWESEPPDLQATQ